MGPLHANIHGSELTETKYGPAKSRMIPALVHIPM